MKLYLSLKAKKQLGKLPTSERRKIEKKFLNLSQDPFLGKKLSGEFKDCWSLKAWPYRVIYVVEVISFVFIKNNICFNKVKRI